MPQKKSTAPKLDDITPSVINKIKDLRRAIGLRKFTSANDRSYTQWKNESENLIIRIFGVTSNQYKQFRDIDHWFITSKPSQPHSYNDAAYYKMLKNGFTKEQISAMSDEQWAKTITSNGVFEEVEREENKRQEEYETKVQNHVDMLKQKMKDAFTAWLNELELFQQEATPKTVIGKSSGVSVKNTLTQSLNVTVNIEQVINNIIEDVRANEPDEARIKEVEENLAVLKSELKKEKPQWSKIKTVLIWALNFSRDIFLKVLPIILDKYPNS